MIVATGGKARLAFGIESTFGGGGTANNVFGVGQRLTGIGGRNEIDRIYSIGSNVPTTLVSRRFEGTWSVEAILGDTTWSNAVFTGTGGTLGGNPSSLVIEVGFDAEEKVLRKLKGAVIRRLSLGTRVGEVVRVRFDGVYAKEEVSTPTSITPVFDNTVPYTFAGGSLTFAGQTVSLVQAVDFDITTGFDLVYALGDRRAVAMIPRAVQVGGRFSATARSSSFVKYMLGLGDGTATEPKQLGNVTDVNMVLTFTNGTTTKTLTFSGVTIDELGSAIEAGEMILFDVTFIAKQVTFA